MDVRTVDRRILTLGFLAAAVATACSTPVYRYALEHWEPDRYVLEARLPEGAPGNVQAALDALQEQGRANVAVRRADAGGAEGTFVLRFPHAPPEHPPVATLPATAANLALLCDSPARAETAKRLLAGETAVFLFLESGDEAKDKAALARLEGTIGDMEKNLELPAQPPDDALVAGSQAPPALRIDFSVVRVRRDDPKEKVLVDVLLATEPDLRDLEGPMVFPVYGRGRALYAIVDKGINAEVLYDAGAFVTGACSCQVKAQNPGVDLPMTAAWDSIFQDVVYQEVELPPLTAISVAGTAAAEDSTDSSGGVSACAAPRPPPEDEEISPESAPAEAAVPLGAPVVGFVAALALAALVGTVFLVVRSRRA